MIPWGCVSWALLLVIIRAIAWLPTYRSLEGGYWANLSFSQLGIIGWGLGRLGEEEPELWCSAREKHLTGRGEGVGLFGPG